MFVGLSIDVFKEFKKSKKNSLGEFVIIVEENINSRKKSLYELSPDIIKIINKLLDKFSLTDTVEIVHKIGDIGKKDLYKKVLEIQNEK